MKKKSWVSIVFSMAAPHKNLLVLSVLCAVAGVASGVVPYFAVAKIISLFFAGTVTSTQILTWSGVGAAGYFGKLFFHALSTIMSHDAAYRTLKNLRLQITNKMLHAPLGTVMDKTVGEMKNVLVDEVEKIETPLAHMIPELISNLLVPIFIFLYILSLDWRMALISLVTLPIGFIPFVHMFSTYKKKYDKYMEINNHMNSTIVEYVEGIEVIKAFNQSSTSYEKFRNAVEAFRDYTLDWFKSTWLDTTSSQAVFPSTLLGVMPLGLYLFMQGELSGAAYATCIILSLGIIEPLLKAADYINETQVIGYAVQAAQSYLEIEELPSVKKTVKVNNYGISLHDVSFSYDGIKENEVLHGINLEMRPGQFTALVGPSGGGKSTIARLVARFWDVTSGSIEIGGVDIRDIPLSQLTDMVSFVTQDNFLFNDTLMENIRLGKPSATDEEVLEAAGKACCDEFILKLEDGYQTKAGDAGGKLSGGERQRIAIARAILKNAPIVILDEATAFTDPENEAKIQQSIMELTKGKTLLVIAHRLSTINTADQICVLKNGQITAADTHDNLLKNCPLYCDMWNAHINAKQWAAGKSEEEARRNAVC